MPSAYVVGLGASGIAAARLLRREGWQVTASDANTSEGLRQVQRDLAAVGITVLLGDRFTPDAAQMRRIVVSPGVRWDLPALVEARHLGIETLGEMELAWRSLPTSPWIAITGTNGKTTTTSLIAAIFQTAGLDAPACGNIGHAACEVAMRGGEAGYGGTEYDESGQPLIPAVSTRRANAPDWVIAEISSYQIEASSTISPKIGIWTTFTPDHLNRHYTLENYYDIKARLLNQSHYQIINGDDPYLRQHAEHQWPDAYWTSVTGKQNLVANPERGAYLDEGWAMFAGDRIVPVAALRMVGSHNHQNLLMAVAAARLAGVDKEAIAHAIATFPGVPHRLEHICTWRGIDLINDSKATNYDAAQVGLASVAAPAILIAGGEPKAGDDASWLATIQAKAAAVLLIGNAAASFAQRLEQVGFEQYEIVETMERAVQRGAELGQQLGARVVLLSPACASFDQYANFEQRGDHFRQLCEEL